MLNKDQFGVEEQPASGLQVGDQLLGLFGKTRPVTGVQAETPKPGHTTVHTDDGKSQWTKSSLPYSIVPRKPQ